MDQRVGVLAGLHVLVVEDNRDARTIFSRVLRYFGALVTSAVSAAEALQLLRAMRPDVVLTDIQLPDHYGTWLVRQARRRGATTPFVAISSGDLDAGDLAESGFEVFLRKPVDHDRLVDVILSVARRS